MTFFSLFLALNDIRILLLLIDQHSWKLIAELLKLNVFLNIFLRYLWIFRKLNLIISYLDNSLDFDQFNLLYFEISNIVIWLKNQANFKPRFVSLLGQKSLNFLVWKTLLF